MSAHRKLLSVLLFYKKIIQGLTSTLMRNSPHYVLGCIFLEYLHRKLQRLFKQNLCWITLPDAVLRHLLSNLEDTRDEYIDYNSCLLANAHFLNELSNSWFYACSMVTLKKYKLLVIPMPEIAENTVLISESMRHNLQNILRCGQMDESCFLRKYLLNYLSYMYL